MYCLLSRNRRRVKAFRRVRHQYASTCAPSRRITSSESVTPSSGQYVTKRNSNRKKFARRQTNAAGPPPLLARTT